ncbi:MAG: GFA family protein [Hyphomicrobiaceae bacterium]|nr:GFA family protein [Hyphomicrobiaceae bacterium]
MARQPKRSGRCLCGAVTFDMEPAEQHFDACHCGMCRRWAGGPALTVKAAVPPDITGATEIAVYKSSDWGERHFCRKCGTHLFVAAPAFDYFGVSMGALDDPSGLDFKLEIFVDCKPSSYDFANDTTRLTEAQFLEMVAGSAQKD